MIDDPRRGFAYLLLASDAGQKDAKEALDKVLTNPQMTPEMRVEMRNVAEEIKKANSQTDVPR